MVNTAATGKGTGGKRATAKACKSGQHPPAFKGWLTSDADELERRRWRGRTEIVSVEPLEPESSLFGTFAVRSLGGGGPYEVEIRSLSDHENGCGCRDFATNELGTCKHIEGVLHHLRRQGNRAFIAATVAGNPRVEIYGTGHGEGDVRVLWPVAAAVGLRDAVVSLTAAMRDGDDDALAALRRLAAEQPQALRVSRHLDSWLAERRRVTRRRQDRARFLADVEAGRQFLDVLKLPLLPYQVDGMLHLAFGERALLADDMGLGKTVQAIAACALLRRLRGIERVVVIAPASLKAEWREQIARFTDLPARILSGPRAGRLAHYRDPAFFTLANYEQILSDGADINRCLAPDVVIVDEAQRIKNWQTKTARAVKDLHSPYAFVLTGTPLENRIDELYSIVQFLDPKLLGPLFRFNRAYYLLDERGRPEGYRNLDDLGRRLQPIMLRRRKQDIEDQLPGRTLSNYFVAMTAEQRRRYDDYRVPAQRLLHQARKRPLTREEFERLQRLLGCMRMICDTPYILDPDNRDCPKLAELEGLLGDLLAEDESRKIIVFSEWVRMLELVRDLVLDMEVGFAWHTGSVPQDRRRAEIDRFRTDPACRLLLSSQAGGVGLNLQVADTVINMDLPWNPAKLEQRIARAWRKHQTRAVGVINLIAEDSIEHRMLDLLAQKQDLADGVLDGLGDLKVMPMPTGRAAIIERMEAVMAEAAPDTAAPAEDNPAARLRDELLSRHGERLLSLISQGDDGAGVLLAVLDAEPSELAAEHERLKAAGGPAVELLDRATFATICRLEAAGALRLTGETTRELYRSPALDDGAALRRQEARRLAAEADRKLRMAALLAGGGFEPEAVAPAGEAVQAALRALAALSGDGDPGTGAGIDELAERLGERHMLPPPLKDRVAAARCDDTGSPPPLPLADAVLVHVRGVLEATV